MFGKKVVVDMINRSAENEADRRVFLRQAGLAGLGVVGATALSGAGSQKAAAAPRAGGPSDSAILNFALNLEYLEAEFYLHAYYGWGVPSASTSGKGARGGVTGGHKVPFKSKSVAQYAREIAEDELNHVEFLRTALGSAAVSRPKIDLKASFTAAARAAGLINSHQTFDPFANENNFLLAAFLFEDVGVTAYKGAAPLIDNPDYLEAAAGILAVEAYHAGIVRTSLYAKGLYAQVQKLSNARDSLDGKSDDDRGVGNRKRGNLVPADKNSIVYSRTPGAVLNIVYLNPKSVTKGGFFPAGVNGEVNTSAGTA
ncbi:ferritin-like domain-containing protein [uncultured Friedmanniella sp.]|uniref:ferritin-like domain-containing protein n=1 Tax=uncultured Friedmanniella sp. TaxID=335381 RepID=UPI0035CA4DC5